MQRWGANSLMRLVVNLFACERSVEGTLKLLSLYEHILKTTHFKEKKHTVQNVELSYYYVSIHHSVRIGQKNWWLPSYFLYNLI